MAERNRSHIVVQGRVTAEEYTRKARGGGDEVTPPVDRAGHARRLIAALERAESAGHRRRQAASATVEGAIPGIYVTFESFPGVELALTSLEPQQGKVHAELRSVQERHSAAGAVQVATVFVPDGKLGTFVRKLEKYASTAAEEKPRNRTLADPVSEIALASIRALWTDLPTDFPAIGPRVWWEVWLRRRDGNEPARFTQFAEAAGCQVGPNRLSFKDRTVILVQATVAQLAGAVDVLDDLAELRRPHQPEAVLALDLSWPGDVLADLGSALVTLRVTLSYFVEPNPASRGWDRRYSYQSHGLRFDLRRATESTEEFRKRLNDKALDEDERRPPSAESDTEAWMFGPRSRGTGSIHSDIWTGTAADLARRGLLAVYPVTGWWKENKSRDRSERGARYALLVSIETPGQDVDIWTPVAAQVGVPIEVQS